MVRPIGLLRAGYPYLKTLGMRRITNFPYDVAFGKDDILYVLIRSSGTAFVRVWTFDDAEQLSDELIGPKYTIGGYGTDEGKFQWPVQIITNTEGQLIISDEATHTISKFNTDGEFVSRWGTEGSGTGQFRGPAGISFTPDGNLIVIDALNNRVQEYTENGEFIGEFGSQGNLPGEFNNPWGVHVDENGDIYVADWGNDRVQIFSSEGEFKMVIEGETPDGLSIKKPTSVAVDKHGDIYLTDWGNNRVLLYNQDGKYVWRFLGDASLSRSARSYMLTNARPNRLREMSNLEEEKYFRHPTSVRVDENFRICVAAHYSYPVQVYQKDAIELDELTITPPLRNPTLDVV